jgi:hypothetical protein
MTNAIKITSAVNGFIVEVPNNANATAEILETLIGVVVEKVGIEEFPNIKGIFNGLPNLQTSKPDVFVFASFPEVLAFLKSVEEGGELDEEGKLYSEVENAFSE